ncbi:TatD family hydrolase [Paradesulfitobacterium ferrireducens]|uniref:TatD family hydrolase n=1 Tax=Paradesulfitobacterium ferrireducens TaxID=2816476 RepID=UPI001A8CD980|nr:TatD family hydrolase [Paradesulfitobacterium ferrireducens]
MIWDTHAHVDDTRYTDDFPEMLGRAQAAGITRILNVGYDLPSSERSLKLARECDFIYAAVGIHPHDAKDVTDTTWDALRELAADPKAVAWGEIGLDYYRDLSPRALQQEVFIRQIELADEAGLPIIIHNRDAHEDVYRIVKEHTPKHGGVFHTYSGSWEMAKQLLNLGFYLSFAGPLTYKNARQVLEVAEKVPSDRYLLETDSPYLTPEPYRGKRNEPAYVREVAVRLAQARSLPLEEVAVQAWQNAERLFKI